MALSEMHGIVYHVSDPWEHTVYQNFHIEIYRKMRGENNLTGGALEIGLHTTSMLLSNLLGCTNISKQ